MSTLLVAPDMRLDYTDEDDPGFLTAEFPLPAEADLSDAPQAAAERERYDEQILAALVSP